MLEVKNVSKNFQSGDSTVKAVHDVSFKVSEGSFASIIGQSGSGKSTLLALMGTLEQPSEGKIEINGEDITKLSDHSLIHFRAKNIGFVFQNYNLIPNLTAIENVMIAMEFSGAKKADRLEKATKLLTEVGLDVTKQNRKPGRLSGGEQQRVAIARALANSPKLILADEPTGNLDSETGKKVFDLLHNLSKKQNTTIVVVTHDLTIAGKTDLIFKLKDGKIVKN